MASSEEHRKYDFRRAKDELSLRPREVLERLGCVERPGSKWTQANRFWFIRPPRFPDADTFWVSRDDGSWRHEGKNMSGDVIDLIAYVRSETKLQALEWAYKFLGWQPGVAGAAQGLTPEQLRAAQVERERRWAVQEAERLAEGNKLATYWARLPSAQGTVAETYLREARGIPMERLAKFPGALHFDKRAVHIDDETGEETYWPAMVALMSRDGKNGGTGVHRTYLRPDGSGKADVNPQKKMRGVKKGSAIRLTRGAGDFAPRDALAKGHKCPLIIGEGIETVLSVAVFMPDYRAWAAGDIGNMGGFAWPGYASHIVLLRDNDLAPEAVAAFGKVERHWMTLGRETGGKVIVVNSDEGSDFNDELRRA